MRTLPKCTNSPVHVFPIYILPHTPAFSLLNTYWPELSESISSKQLLEMISLLNKQWLNDPSVQWLPFEDQNWELLFSLLEVQFNDPMDASIDVIRFYKYSLLAAHYSRAIKKSISISSLAHKMIRIYLSRLENYRVFNDQSFRSIAEHIFDFLTLSLDLFGEAEASISIVIVAYARCSSLWNESKVFQSLVKRIACHLQGQIYFTETELQRTAFKLLFLAKEPTDKRLLEALAFGEIVELEKISSFILMAICKELFPPSLFLPSEPSSLFLATLLSISKINQDSFIHTFPSREEIFALIDEETSNLNREGYLRLSADYLSFTSSVSQYGKLFVPSINGIMVLSSQQTFFKRALAIHRIDMAYELRQELEDIVKRLYPGPSRWARMGCWIAANSPSVIQKEAPPLGKSLPASILVSVEILLPTLPDVIEEWDLLKKGTLLFLMKASSAELIEHVRACEFEGFLSLEGSIVDALSKYQRKTMAERRMLVVRIYPESLDDVDFSFAFNILARRDAKSAPVKLFLKALYSEALKLKASIPALQKHSNGSSLKISSISHNIRHYETVKTVLNTNNKVSLILGPPGSGKTEVAAEIISTLYSQSSEKLLIVSPSHSTVSELLVRLLDTFPSISPSHLVRLAHSGEFSRVSSSELLSSIDARRIELLANVDELAKELGMDTADHGASCESAETFWLTMLTDPSLHSDVSLIELFSELRRLRPIEVIPTVAEKLRYLVVHEARIVAATPQQVIRDMADLRRAKFTTLVIDNASLLAQAEAALIASIVSCNRLILIGDYTSLPPVMHNPVVNNETGVERSLFADLFMASTDADRCVLNTLWRFRPEISQLISWRYSSPQSPLLVSEPYPKDSHPSAAFPISNEGFVYTFQWIDIPNGCESEPVPNYFQNLAEAEYAVALFQLMVMLGYNPNTISIITTYNGQKDLISDILRQKAISMPRDVASVDQFQGISNDYIILSMVRTKRLGYLQDLRRWMVALSRGKLGLYVVGYWSLFREAADAGCSAFGPSLDVFASVPRSLMVRINEIESTDIIITDANHLNSLFNLLKKKRDGENLNGQEEEDN